MKHAIIPALLLVALDRSAFAQAKPARQPATKAVQTQLDDLRLENAKLQGSIETLRDELRQCRLEAQVRPKEPDAAVGVRDALRKAVSAYDTGSIDEFRRSFVDARAAFDSLPADNSNRDALSAIVTSLADAIGLLKEFEGNTNRRTFNTIVAGDVYDPCLERHPELRGCTGETSHMYGSYVVHNLKGGIDCIVRNAGSQISTLTVAQ